MKPEVHWPSELEIQKHKVSFLQKAFVVVATFCCIHNRLIYLSYAGNWIIHLCFRWRRSQNLETICYPHKGTQALPEDFRSSGLMKVCIGCTRLGRPIPKAGIKTQLEFLERRKCQNSFKPKSLKHIFLP